MKKLFYLFVLLAFFACNNKDTENSVLEGETYDVKVNISSFDVEEQSMTRIGQTTLSNVIKQYGIYIYNASGQRVALEEKSNISDTLVKDVKFKLPLGNYTAVVVAYNENVSNVLKNTTTLSSAYTYNYIYKYNAFFQDCAGCYSGNNYLTTYNYSHNDYFYKKVSFSISQNTVVDVVAPRVTGRVEIIANDIDVIGNYPATDYAYVKITTSNMNYGLRLNDKQSRGSIISTIYMSRKEWETYSNKPMIFNCMPSTNPKITFEFSDSWANCFNPSYDTPVISYKKEITGFEVYENKITRLKGNIFDPAGFNISIDTNFGGVVTGDF